jgi:hypothetical protein
MQFDAAEEICRLARPREMIAAADKVLPRGRVARRQSPHLSDFLGRIGCEHAVPTAILRFEYGKTTASASGEYGATASGGRDRALPDRIVLPSAVGRGSQASRRNGSGQ